MRGAHSDMDTDVHYFLVAFLLGVSYAQPQTQDVYSVVEVQPKCGSDDLGYAFINVTIGSVMLSQVVAECANGEFNFSKVDDFTFYIGVSYFPSSICTFNKRRDDKVYVINLVASYGNRALQEEKLEYTVTCTFSAKADSFTSGQHVVEGLIAPIELQTHNGQVSDVPVTIQMTDVSGNNLDGQRVHLGRPVQLTLEGSDVLLTGVVGIMPTACDAVGLSSGRHYAVLRAGCGDGLIFQKDMGFTTEGLVSKSPYFDAFGIDRDIRLRFECNVTICYSSCDGGSCVSEKRKRSPESEQDSIPVVSVGMEWSLSEPNHMPTSNIHNTRPEANIEPIVSVSSKDIDMLDDPIIEAIPKTISDSAIMSNDVPNKYIYGKTISNQELSPDNDEDDLPIDELHEKLVELAKVLSNDDFDKLEEAMRAGRLPRSRRNERGARLQQDHSPAQGSPKSVHEHAGLGEINQSGLLQSFAVSATEDGFARGDTKEVESTFELSSNDKIQAYPDGSPSGPKSLTERPGGDQLTSVTDFFYETGSSITPLAPFDQPVPEVHTSTAEHGHSIEKRSSHKHDVFLGNGIPFLGKDLFHDKRIPIGHVGKEHMYKSNGNRTHPEESRSSEVREVREAIHAEDERDIRGDNYDERDTRVDNYDGGFMGEDATEAIAERDRNRMAGIGKEVESLLELINNLINVFPSEAGGDYTIEDIPIVKKVAHTDDRQIDEYITDEHELHEMAAIAGENIIDGSVRDVDFYDVTEEQSDGDKLGEAVFMNRQHGELYDENVVDNQTPGWLAEIFHDIELDVTSDGVRLTDIRGVESTFDGYDIVTLDRDHNTEVNRNTESNVIHTMDTEIAIPRNTDVDTTLNRIGDADDSMFNSNNNVDTLRHRNTDPKVAQVVQLAKNELSGEYEYDSLLPLHADVPGRNTDASDLLTLLSYVNADLAVIESLTENHLSDSADIYISEKRFEGVSEEIETVDMPFIDAKVSHEQMPSNGEHTYLLDLKAGSDSLFDKSASTKGDGSIGSEVYLHETGNRDVETSAKRREGPLSEVLLRQPVRAQQSEMILQTSGFAVSTIIIVNLSILTFMSIVFVALWVAILFLNPFRRNSFDVERCQ